jgi:hypothetical protein
VNVRSGSALSSAPHCRKGAEEEISIRLSGEVLLDDYTKGVLIKLQEKYLI